MSRKCLGSVTEVKGLKRLSSWSFGIPLPLSVMVSCSLSLCWVVVIVTCWPVELCWMAFFSGAAIRCLREVSGRLTGGRLVELRRVIVTCWSSARDWRLLTVVLSCSVRLVW